MGQCTSGEFTAAEFVQVGCGQENRERSCGPVISPGPELVDVTSDCCRQCNGRYRLTPDIAGRSPAVYRQCLGQGEQQDTHYLYRGTNGRWYVDGSIALRKRFRCNEGFLRSSVSPEMDMESLLWQHASGGKWLDDASIKVRPLSGDAEAIAEASPQSEPLIAEASTQSEPLVKALLTNVTLEQLRRSFEPEDWVVHAYLTEVLRVPGHTISSSIRAREGAGNARREARESQFLMPLPQDVPEVIAKLVGLPETVSTKCTYRLVTSEDSIFLQSKSMVSGVMFAENFLVVGTTLLQQSSSGVAYAGWTEVEWVHALPIGFGFITSYLEYRVRLEGEDFASKFSRLLDGLGKPRDPAALIATNWTEDWSLGKSA